MQKIIKNTQTVPEERFVACCRFESGKKISANASASFLKVAFSFIGNKSAVILRNVLSCL